MKNKMIAAALAVNVLFMILFSSCNITTDEYTPSSCVVLMYHLVMDEPYSENAYLFVTEKEFNEQMALIYESGARTETASKIPHCKNSIILTFDDGYECIYSTVFPVLQKYNFKATVFLVSDTVGTQGHLSYEQIEELSKTGLFEFGSHGKTHKSLASLSAEELTYELVYSRNFIRNLTGKTPECFAYPNGIYNAETETETGKYYNIALTTNAPVNGKVYTLTAIPRITVNRGAGIGVIKEAFSLIGIVE